MAQTSPGKPFLDAPPAASRLIAGQFAVDFAQPLPESGGGLPAFAVSSATASHGSPPTLMAVQVRRGWPARHRALQTLQSLTAGQSVPGAVIPDLSLPLGHGAAPMPDGEEGYFIVCTAPANGMAAARPLTSIATPWSEADLVSRILRPVAAALAALDHRGLTHRAIRPDNVFLSAGGETAWLGCAWAAPPASHQPARAEPAYALMCDPAAQGDGSIADDVYALGALMMQLALDSDPLAGLSTEAVIHRKLDLGSYAALLGDCRIPAGIAEIVRGMVADDPEHRPSPALLGDLPALRTRRIAARPIRRAQRPLDTGPTPEPGSPRPGVTPIHTSRALAYAAARQPASILTLLRNGAASLWLRRMVGDAAMAARLDDASSLHAASRSRDERRADAVLIMSAVAILDPLAPMAWAGAVFWPDGIGPALDNAHHADAEAARLAGLYSVVASDVLGDWALLRPGRSDPASFRAPMRTFQRWLSLKPAHGGPARLRYALNPLSPCRSGLVGRSWVIRLADVLPAIEGALVGRQTQPFGIDRELVAFLAARKDERIDSTIGLAIGMVDSVDPTSGMRLFAKLHAFYRCGPMPALAGWIAEGLGAGLDRLHSQSRRKLLARQLAEAVAEGDLAAVVGIIDNEQEEAVDHAAQRLAADRMRAIDRMSLNIPPDLERARTGARRTGQDVAYASGMLAVGIALAIVLIG